MRIAIVGAGAAGLAAATRAKRVKPDAEVVVFEATGEFSRGTCSLPYLLSGELPGPNCVQGASKADLEKKGVTLNLRTRALRILPHRRLLETDQATVPYDRLIVSTGSQPRTGGLSIDREDPRVWSLKTLADVQKIQQRLATTGHSKRVAVIGGGYVGIEFAEALQALGLEASIFHRQSELMGLRPEIGARVRELLNQHSVSTHLNQQVRQCLLDDDAVRLELDCLTTGRTSTHRFDAVALATGIEPETTLLREAGARLGASGAVQVNSRGETSLSNVFACGDGVEVPNRDGGLGRWIPLATMAARLGRVCGENAANGSARLGNGVGALSLRLFDRQLGVLGQPRDWTDAHMTNFEWGRDEHPFARRRKGYGVLFSDPRTQKLKGLQAVGPEAGHLVDLVSLGLERGLTIEELQDQDFCYNPPLSGLWNPLYLASRKATHDQTASEGGFRR